MLTTAGQTSLPGFLSSLSPPQGSAGFEVRPLAELIQGRCPPAPPWTPASIRAATATCRHSRPVAHVHRRAGSRGRRDDRWAGGALQRRHQKRSGGHCAIRSGEGGPRVLRELRIKPLSQSPSWVHFQGRWPFTVGRSPLCGVSAPLSWTRCCLHRHGALPGRCPSGSQGPGGRLATRTAHLPVCSRQLHHDRGPTSHSHASRAWRPCLCVANASARVEDSSPGGAPTRQRSLPPPASPHGPRQTSCPYGAACSKRFLYMNHTARGLLRLASRPVCDAFRAGPRCGLLTVVPLISRWAPGHSHLPAALLSATVILHARVLVRTWAVTSRGWTPTVPPGQQRLVMGDCMLTLERRPACPPGGPGMYFCFS